MIEEREESMAPATAGGISYRRIGYFLKATDCYEDAPELKFPFLSPKPKWPLEVIFHGWRHPQERWVEWIEHMQPKHQELWKKAGIFDAIMFSKCRFERNDDLILGVAERWCCETNTFVFPWGEATVTLEDTMILLGLPVLGFPVFLPVEGDELKQAENGLTGLSEDLLNHRQWLDLFMNSGRKGEHEAFLSLWLSRFVFPGSHFDRIGQHVFPIAVHLSRGIRIALAPAVLANVYKDLSLIKVAMGSSLEMQAESGDPGSYLGAGIWAPLQLVQLWIWERFVTFRPMPNDLEAGEMRAFRWHDGINEDIGNVRPILNSYGDAFLWKPYCLALKGWYFPKFYREEGGWVQIGHCLEEELESFIRCLRSSILVGTDGFETYQPHRVAMQLGLDQDLPVVVPRFNGSKEEAWITYNKPYNDSRLYLPARLFDSDLTVKCQEWWRGTFMVPVSPFEGVVKRFRVHIKSAGRRNTAEAKLQFPDVPPGFPAKSKHVAVSQNQMKEGRNNSKDPLGLPSQNGEFPVRTLRKSAGCSTAPDANLQFPDVPPGFPAKSKHVAVSQNQMEEGRNNSEDSLGLQSQNGEFPVRTLRKSAGCSTAPDANRQFPDVPPGFPAKSKYVAVSQNQMEEGGNNYEDSLGLQSQNGEFPVRTLRKSAGCSTAPDANRQFPDVPPGFPAKSKHVVVSLNQIKDGGNDSEDPARLPCKNGDCHVPRPGASSNLQIREECNDSKHPNNPEASMEKQIKGNEAPHALSNEEYKQWLKEYFAAGWERSIAARSSVGVSENLQNPVVQQSTVSTGINRNAATSSARQHPATVSTGINRNAAISSARQHPVVQQSTVSTGINRNAAISLARQHPIVQRSTVSTGINRKAAISSARQHPATVSTAINRNAAISSAQQHPVVQRSTVSTGINRNAAISSARQHPVVQRSAVSTGINRNAAVSSARQHPVVQQSTVSTGINRNAAVSSARQMPVVQQSTVSTGINRNAAIPSPLVYGHIMNPLVQHSIARAIITRYAARSSPLVYGQIHNTIMQQSTSRNAASGNVASSSAGVLGGRRNANVIRAVTIVNELGEPQHVALQFGP